jgi:Exopolysaccharide biosynthesis protein YbjH
MFRLWEIVCCFLLLFSLSAKGQYSMGTTGLLNIPSADMQADGTFMAGANYLPKELLPEAWGYNSGNYFVNLTFLPFMEVAYRCTFLREEFKAGNKLQQDRSVSVRLRPLKEGKWWPSVVVGSNDAFTSGELNPFKESGGNRFFSSVYVVGTKHVVFYDHDIGVTVGGHVPFRQASEKKGFFGGISYSPAFLKPLSLMAEYDSKVVNVGLSARLFHHFSLHAFSYDFKTISGGIRYELTPRGGALYTDENPWTGRLEFVLYPQISLNNSWLDKLYGTVINLAPALEARLWNGAAFTGQVILPVWNNMVGQMDYIRTGVLTMNQEFRLPYGAFGRVTVGNFTDNRMGANLALRYGSTDGRWLVGLEGGLTGSSTFYGGKWKVSHWKRVNASMETRYRMKEWGMDFKVGVHRYLYGDYGVRVDCIRRYGRTVAGLYAMYTGGVANGGFHFAIPLPQWGKHRKVRVRLPSYLQWEYSGQSGGEYFERRLGQSYETRPDEGSGLDYERLRFMKN